MYGNTTLESSFYGIPVSNPDLAKESHFGLSANIIDFQPAGNDRWDEPAAGIRDQVFNPQFNIMEPENSLYVQSANSRGRNPVTNQWDPLPIMWNPRMKRRVEYMYQVMHTDNVQKEEMFEEDRGSFPSLDTGFSFREIGHKGYDRSPHYQSMKQFSPYVQ